MSFLKKAQEAAEAARARVEEAATVASRTASDPTTMQRIDRGIAGAGQGARDAVGLAKRGVNTVIERIDPATLAELIVKATALQEMTNGSLRTKGSPYRISEISISASIPPGVTFAIGRIDDHEEHLEGDVHTSAELIEHGADGEGLVLALDGTTVGDAPVDVTGDAIAEVEAMPGAMPPSSVSRN